MTRPPHSICVFCGSRDGADPAFGAAAEELGRQIAENGWRLVYGAGDVGLMGRVARTAQAAGGETFGVIPVHLFEREVGKRDLSTFIVTENMHERKKVMFMNSDAIVVLPGGAGSLDEFFEVVTWRQLSLHRKPILVLNTNGYWDPLKALIENVVGQGFAEANLYDFAEFVDDVPGLAARLKAALSG
ncbi:TIGR00730 family Rossman fold protein [Actibacterium sp. XHP0104]|uniref:LOG family protein n=1 Tax=Actibacterium sp. XHP0104 TaxID=2984335 RepID=UPI0021E6DDE6|nr:TIGR00730 family Rossman fold protein [Actibacterium sp. XHP0104]MCV2881535.1 TIGR00730 family Rossman fold protein [Actibacterium sp. XHP0104]